MTRARPRVLAALAAVVAAAVAVVVVLVSASGQTAQPRLVESLFQDDNHLVYAPTPVVASTLDTLASLGVDRLRITVLWSAIAPGAASSARPAGFRASDPASYPPFAWAPYDRIVQLAAARHIGVDFNVTAPGPLWAMAGRAPASKLANHFAPSAAEFGGFVAALGRRYSGAYVPPGAHAPLPRVNYWSIWNEPNQPGWLAPQWAVFGGQPRMAAPVLYRALLDSAWRALTLTGHTTASDTILIGELAPEGAEASAPSSPIPPLPFLRTLYCVGADDHPLSGQAAVAAACPSGGRGFVAAHPALFDPTGFAHHPYSFFLAPTSSMPDPNFAPLSDLSRLESTLDAIFSVYGVGRRLPIYLTEYGYETDPPNPYRGVSPGRQSLYLNEAQYLAWRDPRVRAMSQFLLFDSQPDRRFRPGSLRYWSTFQTGLLYANGRRKPSFNSYRLPIVVPQPRFAPGASVFIWAMLRLAPNGTRQDAEIQWRPSGGSYRTLATVTTDDPSGFLTARLRIPGTGAIRVLWISPTGRTFHSRAVGVVEE